MVALTSDDGERLELNLTHAMVKGLLGAAPYLVGALMRPTASHPQSIQLSETAVEAYRPHAVVNLTELAVRVSCLEWENSTATARGGFPRRVDLV